MQVLRQNKCPLPPLESTGAVLSGPLEVTETLALDQHRALSVGLGAAMPQVRAGGC